MSDVERREDRRKFILPLGVTDMAHIDTIRGARILVTPDEVVRRMQEADRSLNSGETRAALYELREWLSDVLEDPERRRRS